MKFTPLERQVLSFIRSQYPIVHNSDDKQTVIAEGERPLATPTAIRKHFPQVKRSLLDTALKNLLAYQCVQKVYLHRRDEFSEVRLAPGSLLRIPNAGPPKGENGYQITKHGEEAMKTFPRNRYWSAATLVGIKLLDRYVLMFFGLILIGIVWLLFGWDIRSWVTGTPPPKPSETKSKGP